MIFKLPLILASQSPSRLRLLGSVKIIPDFVIPAHIDESERRGELPRHLAARLAKEKATAVADKVERGLILAADSVAVVGRKILPKALSAEDIVYCMQQLSGRRHRIYTGICVIRKTETERRTSSKLVSTIIKFKHLTKKEIEDYALLGEGLDKAGGCAISGYAECFVEFISGSYSNIIGLPLTQTMNMLRSFNY